LSHTNGTLLRCDGNALVLYPPISADASERQSNARPGHYWRLNTGPSAVWM
jgi:hypothetical protein